MDHILGIDNEAQRNILLRTVFHVSDTSPDPMFESIILMEQSALKDSLLLNLYNERINARTHSVSS